MLEEVEAYIEYLEEFGEVEKPKMPIFDVSAYTDNEYQSEIASVMQDFENIDELELTLKHLKGE